MLTGEILTASMPQNDKLPKKKKYSFACKGVLFFLNSENFFNSENPDSDNLSKRYQFFQENHSMKFLI